MAHQFFVTVLTFVTLCGLGTVHSHGRLVEPPGRSSLWRFAEFSHYRPPVNYDDNQLFCGSKEVQYEENGGRCGECGDNWADKKPRENENGGFYGRGIISRFYRRGQNITIGVELTAPHLGHFEFKICPLRNSSDVETQGCFDMYRLPILQENDAEFSFEYPIDNATGYINTTVTLPANLTCDRCSFLWYYKTGNSWGECDDGSSAVGCGPQEEFRGCADIVIRP